MSLEEQSFEVGVFLEAFLRILFSALSPAASLSHYSRAYVDIITYGLSVFMTTCWFVFSTWFRKNCLVPGNGELKH